jgi:hypothetical protein
MSNYDWAAATAVTTTEGGEREIETGWQAGLHAGMQTDRQILG